MIELKKITIIYYKISTSLSIKFLHVYVNTITKETHFICDSNKGYVKKSEYYIKILKNSANFGEKINKLQNIKK